MNFEIITPRLYLRDLTENDIDGLFELDSNLLVHTYLGTKPLDNKNQCYDVLHLIQKQYIENGIGRCAIIERKSNAFLGWAGLKLNKEPINNFNNFYDLGYRLMPKYWNQGFATEAAKAWIHYGFEKINLNEVHAMIDKKNIASKSVLLKSGLKHINDFDYEGDESEWYSIMSK